MGDSSETEMDLHKERRASKQTRHRANKVYNTRKVDESGVEHRKANPECFIFRGGPRQADFYPSSGRWKVIGTNKVISGGVNKFLAWLDGKETW